MRAPGPKNGRSSEGLTAQGVERLLKLESEARKAESVTELVVLIANETPSLTHAAQCFVLKAGWRRFRVQAAMAIGRVNAHAPRVQWIENVVANLSAHIGLGAAREFNPRAYGDAADPETNEFPYRAFLWVPMKLRDGQVFSGLLLARDRPWTQGEIVIAKRLAETYEHAWAALGGPRRLRRRPYARPIAFFLMAACIAGGFYPVPLMVIAPVEIRSVEPRTIAAPLDGVVDSVVVSPNDIIAEGQVVVKLVDTTLRNELTIAEQALNVAEARLKKVTQSAVDDPKARAELTIIRSEAMLAMAKRDFSLELLRRSVITSPTAGVAIFSDKQEWAGRPVSTGERLMEIADPDRVQLRIDVPVADVLSVHAGAHVRAFLDSDPLRSVAAKVTSVSFEAIPREGNLLAYRIYAEIEDQALRPRLGVRGTAQIFGKEVPLAYQLFRRPIAALRQRFGL